MSDPESVTTNHGTSNKNLPAFGWLAFLLSVSLAAIVVIVINFNGHQHSRQLSSSASSVAANLTAPKGQAAASQSGFAGVVDRTKPAVVSVRVEIGQPVGVAYDGVMSGRRQTGSPFFRFFGTPGAPTVPQGGPALVGEGSGFFVSADGYVVTNNHVVDNAQRVQVTTDDGSVYPARVVGTDPRTDLALIKVEANRSFPYVKFANQMPRVGDWVIAIGNPFGLGNTVTAGIVSATGRDIGAGPYDKFIQVDAPINRGNSGGPTFDLNGNVVGVNSMIFSPSGGSVGIGFDIPADTARKVTANLMHYGHVAG